MTRESLRLNKLRPGGFKLGSSLLLVAVLLLLFRATSVLCAAQPQPGTLLWSFTTPYQIGSSPVLARDGTIYLGTPGALYAITNAGSNKWTFPVGVSGSPAVASDGTVYFGNGNATFYAINPDGPLKWSYALQPEFPFKVVYWSSPAVGLDNSVYFVLAGTLYAFSPTGSKKWEHIIDGFPGSTPSFPLSPSLGPDGTIYVAAFWNRAFYALNADGTEKWHFALQNAGGESAAIGKDGTLYVTGYGLYAVSPDGTNFWTAQIPACCSPVIAKDGTIYVPDPDNLSLWSVSPTGKTNWNVAPSGPFYPPPPTTPAIADNGLIYYCNSNAVFAFTPQGNTQWVFAVPYDGSTGQIPPVFSSPAVGPDGTVYACFQNTLYAIAGTNKLADSPWPMYRQNLRHTGKVEKPSLNQPQNRSDGG
jgi:outer membrane protein assembly factor BamB